MTPPFVVWRNLLLCLAPFLWCALTAGQDLTPTPSGDNQSQPASTAIEGTGEDGLPAVTATDFTDIELREHNILHRPIELSDDYTHWIDRTYTYGGTQLNTRAVHLGVEFVNPRDTPVYAAKSGRVVFAGDDTTILLGPDLDYYGNVVVLAHELTSLAGRGIFTLYGHLDEVDVVSGQLVDDLDRIGVIGATGVAIGPHLHFEVRVADPFDYRMTRNPELWLQHYVDRGMIVGSIRNLAGDPLYGKRVTVRSDTYVRDVFSYGGDVVNSDPVWTENFTVGDLPEGEYEVVVLTESGSFAYRQQIAVMAYRTTFVDIKLDE